MSKVIELIIVLVTFNSISAMTQKYEASPPNLYKLQDYPIPIDTVLSALVNEKQAYCHMALVSGSQMECYHSLPSKDTIFYRSLIESSPAIRPWVISEIELQYPSSSICKAVHFNIIEDANLEFSFTSGLIWTDSTYFSYFYTRETRYPKVKKIKFSDLREEQKTMVTHFNDWAYEIFKDKEKSSLGTVPRTFHFGTRANFSNQPKIESIAFCY